MNRHLNALAITGLSLAIPLVAALAQARTSPVIPRAHPATSGNEDCLRYDHGSAGGTARLGLRNQCASNITFQMPLVVDAPQSYTVIVRMRDSGAGGLTCTTRVRDAFGIAPAGGDNSDTNTTPDGDEELIITSKPVPAGGTLLLECVFQGGIVNGVKIFGVDWF